MVFLGGVEVLEAIRIMLEDRIVRMLSTQVEKQKIMGSPSSLPSSRPRTCPHPEAAPNSLTLALSAWRNIAPPLKIASAIGVPPSLAKQRGSRTP
jgi:hypothetical protein